MVLLFLGPKGSGKDTQAEILVEKYGFVNVSTGELFRQEIKAGSELGIKAKQAYDSGHLVSDEIVFAIVEKNLKKLDAENIILNGVVRTQEQIPFMDNILKAMGRNIDKAILFDFSDEEAIRRLSGRWYCPKDGAVYHTVYNPPKEEGVCDNDGTELIQREDDKPESVKMRLKEDREKTGPVIEVFRERKLLTEIDASKSIEDISNELAGILELDS